MDAQRYVGLICFNAQGYLHNKSKIEHFVTDYNPMTNLFDRNTHR